MGNNFFRFKEFTVQQELSAMKVCTDSCLFGSILPVSDNIRRVLDIGAGTGLLSLMYAQKNSEAMIEAVEIDTQAALEAQRNFDTSSWSRRLKIYNADITPFSQNKQSVYDLIISNPPFYENSLLSSKENKNMAFHSKQLTLLQLARVAIKLLKPDGIFAVLLPFYRKNDFIHEMAVAYKPWKIYNVKQTTTHTYFRSIIMFSGEAQEMTETEITIKDQNHQYSEAFISLLKDYYLYLWFFLENLRMIKNIVLDLHSFKAQMAELVDALDSKSGFGNGVQVRFLFWALEKLCKWLIYKAFLFRCTEDVSFFYAFTRFFWCVNDTQYFYAHKVF